ncbi:MAG: ketol-acid reductoisomerase [candidate division Zixibacteria bacterium]
MKRNQNITVLGYGSQGRAIALNLKDSGFNVTVGLRARSKSKSLAQKDKLHAISILSSSIESDYIIVALPDHAHKEILTDNFFNTLQKKTALVFLHGSSIHFKQVVPPKNFPVYLLAPHAPGLAVRDNYLNKISYSAFISVHQGSKQKGFENLSRLARAIGIPKTHLVRTTFADEAIGDLFGEQAVLCGGLARLLKFGFETLVENGIPPQNAYLEVAFQIDLLVELIKKYGLEGMFERISPIARYGSVTNGPRVIDKNVKTQMKKLFGEIKSGEFLKQVDRKRLKLSKKQLSEVTNIQFDKQAKKFSKY